MITRLRIASSRYETGLYVAIVRNQSCSIRLRGSAFEDRKSSTNKSGKSPDESPAPATPPPIRPASAATGAARADRRTAAPASPRASPRMAPWRPSAHVARLTSVRFDERTVTIDRSSPLTFAPSFSGGMLSLTR